MGMCPPASRIAYGLALFSGPNDARSIYEVLRELLPHLQVEDGATDLRYQINRRRRSRVLGGTAAINRLSSWSIATMNSLSLELPTLKVAQAEGETTIRLEMDLNTAPETTTAPLQRAAEVFRELVELSREISQKGDVP